MKLVKNYILCLLFVISVSVKMFAVNISSTITFTFNAIKGYEYWFDNNYSQKVTQFVVGATSYSLNLNVSTLSLNPGVHSFNIRYIDNYGNWSLVSSDLFYKPLPTSNQSGNLMTAYEYWFDNNYSSKVLQSVSSTSVIVINTSIATGAMNPGVHSFNIRYKDSYGKWSMVSSDLFYKPLQTSNQSGNLMTAYEYWFDNNYSSKVLQSVSSTSVIVLNTSVATGAMNPGVHSFNIRYKDSYGKWSMVSSDLFYKPLPTTNQSGNTLAEYEYWFDNDYSQKTTNSISSQNFFVMNSNVSTGNLNSGVHAFNIRFKDDFGNWSSINTSLFYKPYNPTLQSNKIGAYRYWIDTLISQQQNVVLAVPIQFQLLNTALTMTNTPKGKHVFNIQFMDSTRKWSVVQADTFLKVSHPIASFSNNYSVFCDSGTVSFTNHSIDGDTYLWDFGDGNQSNVISPVHHYLGIGQYSVLLTIKDTITLQTSTYTVGIVVSGKPNYSLGSDTLVCPNAPFELSATSSNATNYLWNNGQTTPNLIPTSAGVYWCQATNQYGCSYTDTINVSYKLLATASFSSSISGLVVSFNNSSLNASTYLWNFGDGSTSVLASPTHTFNLPGSYSVALIVFNDCGSDTLYEIVNLVGVGIENAEMGNNILVFPNPNQGAFEIVIKNNQGENTDINLYSSDSKLIFNTSFLVDSDLLVRKLEFDDLSNGFYYLFISNSKGRIVRKIVIVK